MCPLTSHSARGRNFGRGRAKLTKKVFNGPILSLVSVCAVPRGGEGHENINLALTPSLIPPKILFGPKIGFSTQLNSIKVATRAPKSRGSCRDVVVAAGAGLGAAFVGV